MIVSLVNLKGGVGKTTSAMMLAQQAVASGVSRVEVIDVDPTGSACQWADAAADAGEPLGFAVSPGNQTTLRRLARRKGITLADELVLVDCPPDGGATAQAAVDVADFVLVPSGTGEGDLAKTRQTLEVVGDTWHMVLLTQVVSNAITLRWALDDFDAREVSYCESMIPRREEAKRLFGHNPAGRPDFGYDGVFDELAAALEEVAGGGTHGQE